MIQAPLHLAALIAVLTATGFWMEQRFAWATRVGASLLIIILGALVSNLGMVPTASPVYDMVFGPITSLAIVWLLLAVDLRDLRGAGPAMLRAFAVAALGTALGAVTATLLFGRFFPEHGWKIAGVMTGTYTGGSLNFVSVGRELGLPESLFSAATAADNVVTALWFGATLLLPAWLYRRFPRQSRDQRTEKSEAVAHPIFDNIPLKVTDLCILVALGLSLLALSGLLNDFYQTTALAAVIPIPGVLWLTTLALLVGLSPRVRQLSGAMQLGAIALHFFFVLIGIGSRISEIVKEGPAIFFFTLTVVAVHGTVLLIYARLRRQDWDTTTVASQAAVGGPSTAMALAVAREKPELTLPGAMVGLLGYAVGTYSGFIIAALMRQLF